MELNNFELTAILAGSLSVAAVMFIAWVICLELDAKTQRRIAQDKRDLSRIDML